METVQPYLDYFSSNPSWAIVVIFLISFGEALLIIGLFVPSTVVLVGAGMLVGSGHLPFWPVFIATAVGAIAGDQVSYWAGRFYGNRLKDMWPLNKYPQLVAKGEDFVRAHGGKSIAIGRFVPGVKAVVPGIVGMLGMSQMFFLIVNVTSGLFWTAAHVFPGMLLGQGLALAGDLSGRLAIVLLELLIILAVASWVIRLLAAATYSRLGRAQQSLSVRAKSSSSALLRRFGRAVAPTNPRSVFVVIFSAIMLAALAALVIFAINLISNNALPNGDLAVMTLMHELRNAPADQFIIPITMLGDALVLWSLMAVMLLWLLWRRAWRAALAAVVVIAAGKFATLLLDYKLAMRQPIEYYVGVDQFDFNSGHVAVTAITFGLLAALVGQSMGRWSRAVVIAICSLLVIAIAYSRVYLGVQWFSGTVAGLLFGAMMVAAFGVVIEAIPPRRLKPLGLLAASLAAFIVVGFFHIQRDFARAEAQYAPPQRLYVMKQDDWLNSAWKNLQARRIDLAGRQEEKFVLQWAGQLEDLDRGLAAGGWKKTERWAWKDSFQYLDLNAKLEEAAPRPALHEGLMAKLTMVKPLPDTADVRLVLRAYKTEAVVTSDGTSRPVYLVSLTEERLLKRLHTYTVPVLSEPKTDQLAALKQQLAALPQVLSQDYPDRALTLYWPK